MPEGLDRNGFFRDLIKRAGGAIEVETCSCNVCIANLYQRIFFSPISSDLIHCDHEGCFETENLVPCFLPDKNNEYDVEIPDHYYCDRHAIENGFTEKCEFSKINQDEE